MDSGSGMGLHAREGGCEAFIFNSKIIFHVKSDVHGLVIITKYLIQDGKVLTCLLMHSYNFHNKHTYISLRFHLEPGKY